MTSAQDFLTEFTKQIVHNVDTRPQIVQQWTERLEAREAELHTEWYKSFLIRFEANLDREGIKSNSLEAAKKAAGIE